MTTSPPLPSEAFDDRFQQVVEASPTGVIVVDADCRILLVNRQIETWFQFGRVELVGQFIEVLVPDYIRPAHVDLRNEYLRAPRVRPIGSGRDLYARRQDGTEFPCDISLHPLPSNSGLQIMVHIVDITERKRIEALRRQQESVRQLQFIVDNLPAGAVHVSGGALVANRAVERITGYRCDELSTAEAWFSKLFGDRADEIRQAHAIQRDEGFPAPLTLQIRRKDADLRWVEMSAYGDQEHELWVIHDITEQRLAEERLVQGERLAAIGQMMTALAHESRNALQRAQACLEMMELDLEDQPELLDLTQRTQNALDELQRLYEEVRGYASPIGLEFQPTNLRSLWERVWGNLLPLCANQSMEFHEECHATQLEIRADQHRMEQVLRNILENSIAALPSVRGVISVSCRDVTVGDAEFLELSIRDNGPGLTAEQRARIFEPFFTTKARGTGLGMAIAKRIMEAHGGSIAVGPLTAGTEIVLQLPR